MLRGKTAFSNPNFLSFKFNNNLIIIFTLKKFDLLHIWFLTKACIVFIIYTVKPFIRSLLNVGITRNLMSATF